MDGWIQNVRGMDLGMPVVEQAGGRGAGKGRVGGRERSRELLSQAAEGSVEGAGQRRGTRWLASERSQLYSAALGYNTAAAPLTIRMG